MTFLPEEDRELLSSKHIQFEELEEKLAANNIRRAVRFPSFGFQGNLHQHVDGKLTPLTSCDLLVVIPPGYATTRLDSFYTRPHLKRPNGLFPDRAHVIQKLFQLDWQFWSRHLTEDDWKMGGRDLVTYLQIVRDALRIA